jgi:hypothetical protein
VATLGGLKFIQQSAADARSHILGFTVPRTTASDLLFDIWNGATSAGRKASVDLDGKFYSAALTAGDLLYAVTGGVTGVRRLDPLAIGTANQVLRVNAGATAPEWASTLSGLTLAGATISGTLTGTPTWASAQAITLSTAAQPNVTSVGTLTGLAVSGGTGVQDLTVARDASSGVVYFGTDAARWIFYDGTQYIFRTPGLVAMALSDAGALLLAAGLTAVAGAFSGLLSANLGLTVAAGQTLTLTGATVTGAPTWGSTQSLNTSGLAASATKLATARAINGVDFDGTAPITVTAAAGTLTGTTLNATVVSSSLTSLGTITTLTAITANITNLAIASRALSTSVDYACLLLTGTQSGMTNAGVRNVVQLNPFLRPSGAVGAETLAIGRVLYVQPVVQSTGNDTTVTNGYGIYIDDKPHSGTGSGGTITNLYGLYVADIDDGGTLNYAIYTNAGLVRFGGAVTCASTLTTNGGLQTFGANDSAGAGYRLVRVPNV